MNLHVRSRLRLVFSATALLVTSNAFSEVLYVDVNSVSPTPPYADWASAARTIQDAVDVAQVGDTVLVTNGVYNEGGRAVGVGAINRVAIDQGITVQSVNGPGVTVIDGANADRCAYVGDGAVLIGFTLTGGVVPGFDYGGGVSCTSYGVVTNCALTDNSTLFGGGASGGSLYNCTLTGNQASRGGGAYDVKLYRCTLSTNTAERTGGGALGSTLNNCTLSGNNGGNVGGGGAYDSTLYSCILTGNWGQDGGGASEGTLYNCMLTNNYCGRNGAGADYATLYNCILVGNSSEASGAGTYGCTLYNCSLIGNSANGSPGGGASGGTLYNCTLTGNSGGSGGGVYGGILYNCTLAGNSASRGGGGSANSTLYNCIVYYNTAVTNGANYDSSSTFNYCCTTPLPSSGAGNIAQEPGFVDLAGGDYHLRLGSPCINAGINQDWMMGATDLDGNPRIIHGVVDMGAYEFQLYDGIDLADFAQALADLDGDELSDLMEYALGTDPRNPADAQAGLMISIMQDVGGHYASLQFSQRTSTGALPLQYIPEVSGDKQIWYSDGTHVIQVGLTPLDTQFDWVTVRDSTPTTPATPRFIRLRVVSGTIETTSPVSVSSATTIQGNSGTGSRTTFFSQRMVLPILYAGTVSSLQTTSLTDTNANWTVGQFGTNGTQAYVEFNNGWMADIANSTTTTNLALAGNLTGVASVGDSYRIRAHFTIASLFGTNNETGLQSGRNTAKADNIMVMIPQTQQTLTIFYYDNGVNHGWLTADYNPAGHLAIYPEQGLLVRRAAAADRNLFVCGSVKTGVTIAPIEPGHNLVGTLKSISNLTLATLNIYTGNPATGLASGRNTADSDTLLMVQSDGTTATYFYYKDNSGNQGWLDANYNPSANVPINAGSAFFVHRLTRNGSFNWLIPAE